MHPHRHLSLTWNMSHWLNKAIKVTVSLIHRGVLQCLMIPPAVRKELKYGRDVRHPTHRNKAGRAFHNQGQVALQTGKRTIG